jgi:hypothetical protein
MTTAASAVGANAIAATILPTDKLKKAAVEIPPAKLYNVRGGSPKRMFFPTE